MPAVIVGNPPRSLWASEYEAGHLLRVGPTHLQVDFPLARQAAVVSGADHRLKKMKDGDLFLPFTDAEYERHVLSPLYPGRVDLARRLQGNAAAVNNSARKFLLATFTGYKEAAAPSITWRLTTSEREGIHFDEYADHSAHYHSVRYFVNLDDRPRVWRVGPTLDDALADPRVVNALLVGLPVTQRTPTAVNGWLNKNPGVWAHLPTQTLEFAPGEAWLVNSQWVSHEIVSGRRMLAVTLRCDPQSMWDPPLHFMTRAQRLIDGLAVAGAVADVQKAAQQRLADRADELSPADRAEVLLTGWRDEKFVDHGYDHALHDVVTDPTPTEPPPEESQ